MEQVRSHKDLIVWQRSMDLATEIYTLTRGFPQHELYGMVSQTRRAAVSVAANIAEGNARGTSKDYANFISIARGSLMETDTYLLLAVRLNYASDEQIAPLVVIIRQIDRGLLSLREKLLARTQ